MRTCAAAIILFLSLLSISCFCFGGGLTITAMMRRRFVEELHWLEEQEMVDINAIAQAAPGPSSSNTAIMVGFYINGLPGALVSAVAAVIPPVVLLTVVSALYGQIQDFRLFSNLLQFMQIGVAAYILDILLGMVQGLLKTRAPLPIGLLVLCLAGRIIWNISVPKLFLGCLCIGILSALAHRKKGEGC